MRIKRDKVSDAIHHHSEEILKLLEKKGKDYSITLSPIFYKQTFNDYYIRGLKIAIVNKILKDELVIESTYMLRNGGDYKTLKQDSFFTIKRDAFSRIARKQKKGNINSFYTNAMTGKYDEIKYIEKFSKMKKYKQIFNKDIVPLEMKIRIRPDAFICTLLLGDFDEFLYNQFVQVLYMFSSLIFNDRKYISEEMIHYAMQQFNKKIVDLNKAIRNGAVDSQAIKKYNDFVTIFSDIDRKSIVDSITKHIYYNFTNYWVAKGVFKLCDVVGCQKLVALKKNKNYDLKHCDGHYSKFHNDKNNAPKRKRETTNSTNK